MTGPADKKQIMHTIAVFVDPATKIACVVTSGFEESVNYLDRKPLPTKVIWKSGRIADDEDLHIASWDEFILTVTHKVGGKETSMSKAWNYKNCLCEPKDLISTPYKLWLRLEPFSVLVLPAGAGYAEDLAAQGFRMETEFNVNKFKSAGH
eukprot:tig00021441_g21552.t1